MKKFLILPAVIMLLGSLAGCAKQPAAEEESEIPQLIESTAPILAAGDTVTIDNTCEFHVNQIEITEHPEYYYDARQGKTYVDFCITYQHLADYNINADQIMEGKLIYSGLYEYGFDGIVQEEEEPVTWNRAHTIEMKQSDTRQIHYFFTVPKELQESTRTVELHVNIRGNDYRIIVRDGETGIVPGREDSSTSVKDSGDVADGEIVVTDNMEFYVEYSEFTRDVIPPNRGSGYNHYAAEDGTILLDLCIACTNRGTEKITANKAVVSADLKQAEASTHAAEENNRSTFESPSLVNILPLCTEYIHCIFQLPEDMATNDEPLTISFKVDGNKYTYTVK